MYQVIYKDVILFTSPTKQQAIDAITTYVTKRGAIFDTQTKIFGRTILNFHDDENYYTYTIIKNPY